MGSEMCIRDRSQADQSSHEVASLLKGLTGCQRSGPGREDVVHELGRAQGPLFVEGAGSECPDQVGLALAFVQSVLA